ncbi:MAG: hypothetical protein ACOY46_16500 [Bacillota bacterium]
MRLDFYLPVYDFSEKHSVTIGSSREDVYNDILELDIKKSKVIGALLRIRGLYSKLAGGGDWGTTGTGLSIRDMIKDSFLILEDVHNSEIVMGFAGRFWMPSSDMVKFGSPDEFIEYKREGTCKGAWNFYIDEKLGGGTVLSTETRVLCLGRGAKTAFGLYWLIIRPFSGLIRIIMLKMIKAGIEGKS